ncbi:6-deoxyerythronolide-B synthase [Apiospora phragmitis]|uniref:6-deoxyerythronolide-B synthase n=1 Tax=Apiospora phragmitis TaxID=2905665 RepID=A0ABR1VHY4_9PEZI
MKKAVLDHVLGIVPWPAAGGGPRYSLPIANKARVSSRDATMGHAVGYLRLTTRQHPELPLPDQTRFRSRATCFSDPLAIVAAGVGVAPEAMTDKATLGDLGVDSLMAITVLSVVRTGIDLDLSPSPPSSWTVRWSRPRSKPLLLMHMQNWERRPQPPEWKLIRHRSRR